MKYIAFLLSFLISFNLLASTANLDSLEASFDNYHYALEVEWDQKDMEFYESRTNTFLKEINDLILNGLSKEEILKAAERKSKSKSEFEAIQLKMNLLSKQADSPEKLASLLKDHSSSFYNRGASWDSGEVFTVVGIGLAIAAVVGFVVWFNTNYECSQTGTETRCHYDEDRYNNLICREYEVCTGYSQK